MDDLPFHYCDDCDFRFTVIFDNNESFLAGEKQICYCPRCGSQDIELEE